MTFLSKKIFYLSLLNKFIYIFTQLLELTFEIFIYQNQPEQLTCRCSFMECSNRSRFSLRRLVTTLVWSARDLSPLFFAGTRHRARDFT